MEIKVYLHRTKKYKYQVADCFSVDVDLDKLPKDKADDLDYINSGFGNDCRRIARTRDCIKKFGTGYISFMVPQYEGPKEENGNGKYYFDNKEMRFLSVKNKPTKPKKGKIVAHKEENTDEKESL